MLVLHVNTVADAGGAGRAMYRLHKGLRRIGCASSVFAAFSDSLDPSVVTLVPQRGKLGLLRRGLRRGWIACSFERYRGSRPAGYELFSDDRSQHGAAAALQLPACDVLNLHWVAGFVDYPQFFGRALRQVPVVWTLHDMNPFTGGCHYDCGCGRHAEGCGVCPQLGSNDPNDLSRAVWRRKRRALGAIRAGQLHIVSPSRWLALEAGRSALFAHLPISVIPNSLDTDVFSPRERRAARAALELPQEAHVLLYAADSMVNERKGLALLAEALVGLSDVPDVFLVSFGRGGASIGVSLPHLHLGYIQNDRLLSLIYSAADLLVVPSIQDNLPNTVLESLACGTPIVGFDVGGIPEMVRPASTGLLAPSQDVRALSAAIAELLRNPARRAEMGANCRQVAVQEYALEVQARRYAALYSSVLGDMPELRGD